MNGLEAMFQSENFYPTSTYKVDASITNTRPTSVNVTLSLYNIFLPIIGGTIIVLNSVIVVTSGLILRKGQQPRSTYIFLGNVALSDLVIGIAIVFGKYYPIILRNEIICCLLMGSTVSSVLSSVYSIMLIGIDRYLYILYGLQYQRYLNANRARIMVLITWIIGISIGFLPAMGWRNPTENGRFCWYIILASPALVFTTTAIGVLPLFVIIVLYGIILKHALNKIKELKEAAKISGVQSGNMRVFRGGQQFRTESTSAMTLNQIAESTADRTDKNVPKRSSRKGSAKNSGVYNPTKWKAIKIVLFTTGAYFITWFPFFFASFLFAICDPRETPYYCENLRIAVTSPLSILGYCNSLLNPLIYAWWHNGFRDSMKKIWLGIRKSTDNTSSSSDLPRTSESIISGRSEKVITSGSEYELSDVERKTIINKNQDNQIKYC